MEIAETFSLGKDGVMVAINGSHPAQRRYPSEIKERGVRMVHELLFRCRFASRADARRQSSPLHASCPPAGEAYEQSPGLMRTYGPHVEATITWRANDAVRGHLL